MPSLNRCTVFPTVTLMLVACCVMLESVQAQSAGRITGEITDAISGQPVVDVTVGVVGSPIAVGTDENGHYVIDSIPPGLVRLRAEILGYVPISTDYYSVMPDTTVDVDFKLAPIALQLDPVHVTESSPTREWKPVAGAQLITKEDLPPQGNILDAIHGVVAGVRTRGTHEDQRLVVRGAAADAIYVLDGKVIRPPLTFYIDASDVACVEVRRGYSAVTEFKPSVVGPTYAGVVLIFTKDYVGPRPSGCIGQRF